MQRYLMAFSYIGTRYSGLQKQLNTIGIDGSPNTIQGVIEAAINSSYHKIDPKINLILSSRTDKGVHALVNSAHFDLDPTKLRLKMSYKPRALRSRVSTPEVPQPEAMVRQINRALSCAGDTDVRVNNIVIVPDTFHARYSCRWRTYVYRLAKVRPGANVDTCGRHMMESMLPACELNRCYVVGPTFDMDAFTKTLHLCNGAHNFATFVASHSDYSPDLITTRELRVDVTSGRPFMTPFQSDLYDDLQFYDINFSAKSFLYKQIRHVVGAAVCVGKGMFTLDHVRFMLDNPDRNNWLVGMMMAPPGGLFLTNLFYRATETEIHSESGVTEIHDLV